jgi:protein-tyrosine-phosphatase
MVLFYNLPGEGINRRRGVASADGARRLPRRDPVMEMIRRVAFICGGNACRSILAEALARQLYGDVLTAVSAGVTPLGYIMDETLQVLREQGIATEGLYSKSLGEIDFEACRLIINLTQYPLEWHLPASCLPRLVRRWVRDPFDLGIPAFRETRENLKQLLAREFSAWPRRA